MGEQRIHKMRCLVSLCLFLALSTTLVKSMEIPEQLLEEERKAFEICESDKMIGLTWREVEKCEERFGDLLEENGIPVPSEEDFNDADLNGDGTLLFEEWKEWVEGQ